MEPSFVPRQSLLNPPTGLLSREKVKRQKAKVKAQDKEGGPRDIKERTFSFALEIVRLAQRLDERSGVPRVLGGDSGDIILNWARTDG